MSCTSNISKLVLVIFNICFFLFGAASLGVGIWVLVDKSSLMKLTKVGLKENSADVESYLNTPSLVQVGAYVLIGIGSFNFVVGFCGCCGAIKESKCLLYIYAILVGLVLVIELTGGILAAVFKGKVETELKKYLGVTLNKYYIGLPSSINTTDPSKGGLTLAWDYAQVLFKCCGVNGYTDFYPNGTKASLWYKSYRFYNYKDVTYKDNEVFIPPACCKMRDSNEFIAKAKWADYQTYMVNATCPVGIGAGSTEPVEFNSQGCYDAIKEKIMEYSTILIAVGCSIAGVELLGIVAACCLIRSINKEKY